MLFSPDDLNNFIANYGNWTVAFFVGLESMGVPLPGETVLILASAYAGSHDGNVAAVIASAAAGAIIGDKLGYLVGRELGCRFLKRYGSHVGLNQSRIKLGQYLFMRHGGKVVFFGRFFVLLRFLAAFLAGVNRMVWSRFLVANAAGGIVWATVVGLAAYIFGMGLHHARSPLGIAALVLAIGVLVWAVIYLRRNEAKLQLEAEKALPGNARRPHRSLEN